MKLTKQEPLKRGAGILLPVNSLASNYGIGTFGKEAYKFVDFLEESGQKYWQVLPLGPTSYGDSPYQAFSAFAGNPYFIDLDILIAEDLISKEYVEGLDWGQNREDISYDLIYASRFAVLRKAYEKSNHKDSQEYRDFLKENEFWLNDYCEYMTVKNQFDSKGWQEWDEDIKQREASAIEKYITNQSEEMNFWRYTQFEFSKQWNKLKAYANQKGIEIIGDVPIYVALDSADVWINKDQFQLDERLNPTKVAGVPPDMFSATGQLWGNPLYNWDLMEKEDFAWWKKRMEFSAKMYDLIRIDHFIGIVNYFSIPYGEPTAQNGAWVQGPGAKLLGAINTVLEGKKIIAEDLGVVTQQVIDLMEESGYPGMKLMEFAFESDATNTNLPIYYKNNSIVYAGTHDNETLKGFIENMSEASLEFTMKYLNVKNKEEIHWAFIKAGYASVANTAIYQIQDFLELGNQARINTPSTLGCNWRWRLTGTEFTKDLAAKIKDLTVVYGR